MLEQTVLMLEPPEPAVSMTSREVIDALHSRHPSVSGAWVCVDEAFSGFATYATGGIDLLAIGVWQSAAAPGLPRCGKFLLLDGTTTRISLRNALVAYEVKVSRADFRRELYGTKRHGPWPEKAQWAIEHTHYFMFATPKGLLHPDEITQREPWPEGCAPRRGALYLPANVGLIEIDGRGCRVSAEATVNPQPKGLSRHETHELMRRISHTEFHRGYRGGHMTASNTTQETGER